MREWLPLAGIVLSVFVFNTSEFMPMAILTDIGADLGTDEARTGTIISAYAWVVAILSLPLMLLFKKVGYRGLLIGTVAVFIVFQLLSGISQDYTTLLLSRLGVACAHAVFWSIASPLAVRVVPEGRGSMALGAVVMGTSVAMILGLPLGRMIGLALGWRMTFVSMALLALMSISILVASFPKVENDGGFSLKGLPKMLSSRPLVCIYTVTAFLVTGYYTCYSYIEPYMYQIIGMGETAVTFVLALMGIAGILGSILFSTMYGRSPYRFVPITVASVPLCLMLLDTTVSYQPISVLVIFVLGAGISMFNASFQSELLKTVDMNEAPVAMSLQSGIFNLGIAVGTMVGGAVCTELTISEIGYVGGSISLVAALICIMIMVRLMRKRDGISSNHAIYRND